MRIVAAASVVVLLAACGAKGTGSSSPATIPTTVPTAAVSAAPPTTGGNSASPANPMSPTSPANPALPALDTPAPAWRFSKASPDPAQVAALQTALGGPVTVAADAPQSWTFSPPSPSAPARGGTDPQQIAAAVLTAIGRDPTTVTWTVTPDGRTATGTEQLAGIPSPLPFVVTVDGNGRVVSASGHLDSPLSLGAQPRIGTSAAVGELAGAPAGDDRGEQQPSLRPDPTPAVPPISPQPTTEPTVVDRLMSPVTGVTETYVQVPAPDGGAWLLPAYRFTFEDGSSRTLMAVTAPPDGSATADPSPLVGLPEDQAAAEAAAHGWAFRVAERDGVSQLLTADYSPTRVNVAITDGAVTRAWMG